MVRVKVDLKERGYEIIIGIGSTDKNDADNPFDIKLRKKMIRSVINHEKIGRNIKKVIEITDDPSDEKWFDETLKKSGYFDVVVGNNAWVNGIFDEAGYKIKRFRYYKRYFYEGEKIRKLMKEGQKWQNRLPRYLLLLIK